MQLFSLIKQSQIDTSINDTQYMKPNNRQIRENTFPD